MKSWPRSDVPPLQVSVPELCLFDTKSQTTRKLTKKEHYRLYVCGITPYDATHLGHAATYLAFDLVHRFLLAQGSSVGYVQNTTDIDDPLLERAKRDGVDWQALATSQIELFRSDMVDLHILPPTQFRGVIESMNEIIQAISDIEQASATYLVEGDLYCEIHRDPQFGYRSHLSAERALAVFAERGGDPDRVGKRDPFDPLLWRAHRPGEPVWPSPFGDGRPGWHIECQAIALKYLGKNDHGALIDIQGGGSDLIFPHHEMSAAQTSIQTGREFSDFYVHAGMIGLDGEKMSKSRGNLVFVSVLTKSGVNPMAIKIALLSQHYQSDRQWSSNLLEEAEKFLERLVMALSKEDVAPTEAVITGIVHDLSQNLDTPAVIQRLTRWMEETESGASGGSAGSLARALDSLMGLAL